MNAKKLYFTMIGILCVMVVAAGALLYFGNHFMQKYSQALVNAKLDSHTAELKEQSYAQARKDLEKYQDLSALVDKVLPKDKDQARAVGEIYSMASESGISIDRIQFPASTLGQKVAATAGSTGATASSASAASSIVTQAKAVPGLKSVLGIDIDIASSKNMQYNNMITFLQKIELNRRSMQIQKISVTPDLDKNVLSFNVTVTIFVKP